MPSFEKLYYLFKLCLFLLFCFVGGGWLIYDGVADKKGRVTFDDVFPGAAAITAGLLAVGLLYYLRRRAGDDEAADPASHGEASAAPTSVPIQDEASGKPWLSARHGTGQAHRRTEGPPFAGWLELTSLRVQLLVTGALVIVVFGSCAMWGQMAQPVLRNERAAGDLPAQPAGANVPFVERQRRAQTLDQIESALEKGQQFVQSTEKTLSGLGVLEAEQRHKFDQATDNVIAELRGLQTRLDSMQSSSHPADQDRLIQVRKKCATLIERVVRIRNTNGEAVRDKK
ncbi:hypothetical protein R5W23_004343 [Gemmata sp. JC673]|uniref:Uncharacterized protein n=1 Tax=Gemmata algarum TaxID=2975278 RepID=A0ABU5F7Y8_9BACT|nr:hypothetical protein [Gemmata algarum]MDY3562862.1 hypothetical protein [Gemmata algarum]